MMLAIIADHLQAVFRKASDVVCRWGGDEFVVILVGSGPDTAEMLAERFWINLNNDPRLVFLNQDGEEVRVTASIGLGSERLSVPMVSGQALEKPDLVGLYTRLFETTDQAVYRAKEKRNTIVRR